MMSNPISFSDEKNVYSNTHLSENERITEFVRNFGPGAGLKATYCIKENDNKHTYFNYLKKLLNAFRQSGKTEANQQLMNYFKNKLNGDGELDLLEKEEVLEDDKKDLESL